MTVFSFYDSLGWQPFKNSSGETVPPFSIMAVTGIAMRNGHPVYTITKPSTTFYRQYVVSGPLGVPNNGYGRCVVSGPCAVKYTSGGTPANGEGWGPVPGIWTVTANYPAALTVAGIVNSTAKLLLGSLGEITWAIGKTTGAVTGGTSATTSYRFYTTAGGIFSGADAGFTTVPSAYSQVDLDSGIFIKITPCGSVCLLEPLECNA